MKSKVRCEIFFLVMTFFIILCLSITPLSAQYSPGYGMYGYPYDPYGGYGGYPNWAGYPNYGGYAPYGATYGGYQPGYYPNYGYSQPQYYGPYTQSYYNQPYYGYSQPQYYGYPYRQQSYYQPYNYGAPYGGYYSGYNYSQPNSYYGNYPYYSAGLLSIEYTEADFTLDENDDNDEITVDEGDIIGVMLPGEGWSVDTDELDDDIVDLTSPEEISYHNGNQCWIFEAKDVGTTIIKIDCGSFLNTASCGSTFEVEITVED